MNPSFSRFLALPRVEKIDVFTATAQRIGTIPAYVEKDFWVCLVLDTLYNGLPVGHPKLLFKGGTSLSKAFDLIQRFSEDIDIVVFRHDLGFSGDRDPANPKSELPRKKREALFAELRDACSRYVHEKLRPSLAFLFDEAGIACDIIIDHEDKDQQTLLANYESLFETTDLDYVPRRVKIESGARSALDPHADRTVSPFIAGDLPNWPFSVPNITTINPERTLWEKLLILHGSYCGYRDESRLPSDRDRPSRHYYDVAMIAATDIGRNALHDRSLNAAVREHNIIAFRQAWKKFEEAKPGTFRIVPQPELRQAIEKDYRAMQGMILGESPPFGWVLDQLAEIEKEVNAE